MQTRVHVFTFREGLLARLAHDLRLTVGSFELRLERDQLRGWFDPASLRVDGVAHGERVDSGALSEGDTRKIEQTIAREILEASHYPRIELEARVVRDDGDFTALAQLRLHGHDLPLRVPLRRARDRITADLEFAPSRVGIAPYKALGGAIRLQDRVRIRVEIVAEPDKLDAVSAMQGDSLFLPR
jgi:hypothetical protein